MPSDKNNFVNCVGEQQSHWSARVVFTVKVTSVQKHKLHIMFLTRAISQINYCACDFFLSWVRVPGHRFYIRVYIEDIT